MIYHPKQRHMTLEEIRHRQAEIARRRAQDRKKMSENPLPIHAKDDNGDDPLLDRLRGRGHAHADD